jgi:hypothetical protein
MHCGAETTRIRAARKTRNRVFRPQCAKRRPNFAQLGKVSAHSAHNLIDAAKGSQPAVLKVSFHSCGGFHAAT